MLQRLDRLCLSPARHPVVHTDCRHGPGIMVVTMEAAQSRWKIGTKTVTAAGVWAEAAHPADSGTARILRWHQRISRRLRGSAFLRAPHLSRLQLRPRILQRRFLPGLWRPRYWIRLRTGLCSPGYAYDPGYSYGPAPAPQACVGGSYDRYGNWVPNPNCYSGQPQYQPAAAELQFQSTISSSNIHRNTSRTTTPINSSIRSRSRIQS